MASILLFLTFGLTFGGGVLAGSYWERCAVGSPSPPSAVQEQLSSAAPTVASAPAPVRAVAPVMYPPEEASTHPFEEEDDADADAPTVLLSRDGLAELLAEMDT